jgi:hypothetical protein
MLVVPVGLLHSRQEAFLFAGKIGIAFVLLVADNLTDW